MTREGIDTATGISAKHRTVTTNLGTLTLPTSRSLVRIEPADAGTTRMVITAVFPSEEAMDQLIEMGMEEGMRLALGQTDELLRESVTARS